METDCKVDDKFVSEDLVDYSVATAVSVINEAKDLEGTYADCLAC